MRIKQIRDPSLVPVDQLPESYHAKVKAALLSITVSYNCGQKSLGHLFNVSNKLSVFWD